MLFALASDPAACLFTALKSTDLLDTHHLIVSVLSGQMQWNLAIVRRPIDGRPRSQQHQHRVGFALPRCVMQRPHTCQTKQQPMDQDLFETHVRVTYSIVLMNVNNEIN